MKYDVLYNLVKERGFVVVDTKTGVVQEKGFVYDQDYWQQAVDLDDTEGFDVQVDRFLNQKPRQYLMVQKTPHAIFLAGCKIGNKDYVAGFTAGKNWSSMFDVHGKEIFLQG